MGLMPSRPSTFPALSSGCPSRRPTGITAFRPGSGYARPRRLHSFDDFWVQGRFGTGLSIAQDNDLPGSPESGRWVRPNPCGHRLGPSIAEPGRSNATEIAPGPVAPATAMDLPMAPHNALARAVVLASGMDTSNSEVFPPGRRGTVAAAAANCHVELVSRRRGRVLRCAGRPRLHCRSSHSCRSGHGSH